MRIAKRIFEIIRNVYIIIFINKYKIITEFKTLKIKLNLLFAQYIPVFEKLGWTDGIRINFLYFRLFCKIWKTYVESNIKNNIFLKTVVIYRRIAQNLETIKLDKRFDFYRAGTAPVPKITKNENVFIINIMIIIFKPNRKTKKRPKPKYI